MTTLRFQSSAFGLLLLAIGLLLPALSGCNTIDNDVVPSTAVRIDLGTYARWNTYGVTSVGEARIFNRAKQLPKNFPYDANTFTGYGGVLIIMALDIASGTYAPIAFDAACPEENRADVTVNIDPDNFEAYCPNCGSRFNVLTGSGGPISGKAFDHHRGMRTYYCRASQNGGYIITNY